MELAAARLSPGEWQHWLKTLASCPTPCNLQMASGQSLPDYYTILGIDATATEKDVKAAFKKQALLHHPDKLGPMASDAERAAATERIKYIYDAYAVLMDGGSRAAYDSKRKDGEKLDGNSFNTSTQHSMADVWELWVKVVIEGFAHQYDVGTSAERLIQVVGTVLAPVFGGMFAGERGMKIGMAIAMVFNHSGISQTLRGLSVEDQKVFMTAVEELYKASM